MDKLKSFGSKFTFSSTPGGKLSKAFKLDKEHNVLRRAHDPFTDGPMLEDPSLPKTHFYIHCACLFFTFLAICTMGGAIGFQAKWVGVSGGSGFSLFLLILAFLLSAFLFITPIIYDRWDKLKRPAQFLQEARSTLILHAFGTGILLLAAMIVTINAWTAPGCKNPDNDPNAAKGDDFKRGLKQFCDTKKASGIFDWLALICWIALLVLAGLQFNRQRKQSRREPGFIPPSGGVSYANVYNGNEAGHEEERYNPEPKPVEEPTKIAYDPPATANYAYDNQPAQMSVQDTRASMDAYGGAGAGDHTSRTMQLAYNDPYAAIRANLVTDPYAYPAQQPDPYAQPPATYSQAPATYALPNPPQYGGYR